MGSITVGVTGFGPTSLRNAGALLEDWAEARPDDALTFRLDLTLDEDGELSRGVQAAAGFATKHGLDIQAVVPQGQKDPAEDSRLATILAAATKTVKAANPPASVIRYSNVLFLAWEVQSTDEDDQPTEDALRALEAAERFSVPAFDLTDGLLPLAFENDESQPEEAPAPRPDESTSPVQPEKSDTAESDQPLTLGHDIVEELATAVAAAVLAEVLPLIQQVLTQTAPRPRGRPRKTTEED